MFPLHDMRHGEACNEKDFDRSGLVSAKIPLSLEKSGF